MWSWKRNGVLRVTAESMKDPVRLYSQAEVSAWRSCWNTHHRVKSRTRLRLRERERETGTLSVSLCLPPSLLPLSLFLPDCSPALIMGSSFKHIKSDGWWYLPPVWCSTSSNYWRKKIKGGCVWPDNKKLNS